MRNLQILNNELLKEGLTDKDSLFEIIFNESPEALLLLNFTDLTILEANQKAIEFFEAGGEEDLHSESWFALYYTEPVQFSKRLLIDSIKNKKHFQQEITFKTNRGNVFLGKCFVRLLQVNGDDLVLVRIAKSLDYLKADETLATLIKKTSKVTGIEFFKTLTQILAQTFDVGFCYVAEYTNPLRKQIHIVDFYNHGEHTQGMETDIENSPVENVLRGYVTSYPRQLNELFPEDKFTAELDIEGFLATPIFDSKGQTSGVLVLMDNEAVNEIPNARYILNVFASRCGAEFDRLISERKLLEQTRELIFANATKDKFLKIIAHDLKNPFHSIMGFAELLEKKSKEYSKEKIQEVVSIISGNVKDSYLLLENLADWSREQRGKLYSTPTDVQLVGALNDVLEIYERHMQKKEQSVSINIPDDTMIYVDEHMFQTVLRNLISNAIKFSEKKGKINITSKVVNNQVELVIADNGIGIPDEIKGYLGEFETNPANYGTDNEKGTGLGLVLCKSFLEKMDGSISIKSQRGVGTTVKINIPKAAV